MAVVGIDLSSRAIHICLLPEDSNDAQIHVVRLDLERGDATTRIRRLRDRMPARTAWADAGVTLLAIEEPFFAKSMNGLAPLLKVYGGLLQLFPADMPLLPMRADDWRGECSLPKRGPNVKRAAIDFARACWGADAPYALDDNTADAFCIAWSAREIYLRTGIAA